MVTLNCINLGAVPVDRTINSKVLSDDITLTIGDIVELPNDATKFLDGSGQFSELPLKNLEIVNLTNNTALTATVNKEYHLLSGSIGKTITLPTGNVGDLIRFVDAGGVLSSTNTIIINGQTAKINGQSDNLILDVQYVCIELEYVSTGWIVKVSGVTNNANSGATIGDYKYSAQSSNHNGWLLCNGQAISRTTYSTLFGLLGIAFGTGDDSTTFNLPDFRGRVAGMIGQGSGLTNRTIGSSLGEETHVLTENEMPSHAHEYKFDLRQSSTGWSGTSPTSNYLTNGTTSGSNQSDLDNLTKTTGGGLAHNNMQPTLFAGNYFIYSGV
jgi:microcystin-dependent protein